MREMPDGFLSSDINKTVTFIRSRPDFAPWFQLLESMNRLAMRIMPKLDVPTDDKQRLLEATHFARVVQSIQAGILLTERGMEADARNALRAAAETTIFLLRVASDPTLEQRLVENDHHHKQKHASAFLHDPGFVAEMSADDKASLEETLAEIAKMYPGKDPRKLNLAHEAKEAKALHLYNLLFRTASNDASHTSLSSLGRHFVEKENGAKHLQFGPQIKSTNDTLAGLASVFVCALFSVFERFGLTPLRSEGDTLVDQWRALMEAGRKHP